MDIEKKINDVIDNLRPYLLSDGGDIEFIKFEDGIVYVSMKGVCAECGIRFSLGLGARVPNACNTLEKERR